MGTDLSPETLEGVLLGGDLSKLPPRERLEYYLAVCKSLGLNPLTRPFEYLWLPTHNGRRLVLYARRDAADQLRATRGISVSIVSRERLGDVYVVVARAQDPSGRSDEAIGAVSVEGLTGDALANALMRAETKAKRRVTLSLAGLGWLDETEVQHERPAPLPAPVHEVRGSEVPHERPAVTTPLPTPVHEVPGSVDPGSSTPALNLATPAQRRAIHALWHRHVGGSMPRAEAEQALDKWLLARAGVESTSALTRDQASALIDALQSTTTDALLQELRGQEGTHVGD